jgi:pimeloyl-ACP methyl ester carboxylesterase
MITKAKSLVFTSNEGEAQYLARYDQMLARWPVEHESLDIGTRFGTTHTNIAGPKGAPPMLLLHAASVSSTEWVENIAAFAREYRVYAVDTIGDAGKSSAIHLPESVSDFITWLEDVLHSLQIIRPIVVGHSYGGWLAINLALHRPERVSQLVLLAPSATILPFRALINLTLHLPRLLPRFLQPSAALVLKQQAAPGYKPDEVFVELMEACLKHCNIEPMFPTVLTDTELRSISVPTLLLLGQQEKLYDPVAALERAQHLIPFVEGELIPNAGHTLNMEQPELVNERILQFLAQHVHSASLEHV